MAMEPCSGQSTCWQPDPHPAGLEVVRVRGLGFGFRVLTLQHGAQRRGAPVTCLKGGQLEADSVIQARYVAWAGQRPPHRGRRVRGVAAADLHEAREKARDAGVSNSARAPVASGWQAAQAGPAASGNGAGKVASESCMVCTARQQGNKAFPAQPTPCAATAPDC